MFGCICLKLNAFRMLKPLKALIKVPIIFYQKCSFIKIVFESVLSLFVKKAFIVKKKKKKKRDQILEDINPTRK